jgi:hypothetical protein
MKTAQFLVILLLSTLFANDFPEEYERRNQLFLQIRGHLDEVYTLAIEATDEGISDHARMTLHQTAENHAGVTWANVDQFNSISDDFCATRLPFSKMDFKINTLDEAAKTKGTMLLLMHILANYETKLL